ncbi:MAG TPA: putative entry exclusion protein TrbK-alt [Microvirga sp.]|jgi:conjugative transfer region protein TrbK|nr:putative entry exclusion protein TrbK-alt [Microvirga sp.]
MRRRIVTQEELDRPKVRRVIVILAVGTIVSGIAAWVVGVDDENVETRARAADHRPVDPLRSELLRCNGLGQAALDDAACRSAWAENRRRFFSPGERRTAESPQETRP